MNSVFLSPTLVKEPSLLFYLLRWRENDWIHTLCPRLLVLCKMQTASIEVAYSIFYNDNLYISTAFRSLMCISLNIEFFNKKKAIFWPKGIIYIQTNISKDNKRPSFLATLFLHWASFTFHYKEINLIDLILSFIPH